PVEIRDGGKIGTGITTEARRTQRQNGGIKHKDTKAQRPQRKPASRAFDAGFLCGLCALVSLCLIPPFCLCVLRASVVIPVPIFPPSRISNCHYRTGEGWRPMPVLR